MNGTPRQLLRQLKVLEGPFTPFDVDATAATPQKQFLAWLEDAIVAKVPEPHAMTLSTCDERGNPDARVLILKDIDEAGWHFAISSASPKGLQLRHRPRAALTFYWQQLGRQVRLRGSVTELDRAASDADFQDRSVGSRVGALVARQSEILHSTEELETALADQHEKISRDPQLRLPTWTVKVLCPDTVEFWQGDPERRHVRLLYTRQSDGWSQLRLWP